MESTLLGQANLFLDWFFPFSKRVVPTSFVCCCQLCSLWIIHLIFLTLITWGRRIQPMVNDQRMKALTFSLIFPYLARLKIGHIGIEGSQLIANISNQWPSIRFRSTTYETLVIQFDHQTVFHRLQKRSIEKGMRWHCRKGSFLYIGNEVDVVTQGLNTIKTGDQWKWYITIFGHLLSKEDVCLKILTAEIIFPRYRRSSFHPFRLRDGADAYTWRRRSSFNCGSV